jgi:hypothetical protein
MGGAACGMGAASLSARVLIPCKATNLVGSSFWLTLDSDPLRASLEIKFKGFLRLDHPDL